MPDEATQQIDLCAEVEMTPAQCNEVIEDKLDNLLPVMNCTLKSMQQAEDALSNGRTDWRRALKRAKRRVES